MDPFDLEIEKVELEEIMQKARNKLEKMEPIDLHKKVLLKNIVKNAFKKIKKIISLEQVMYCLCFLLSIFFFLLITNNVYQEIICYCIFIFNCCFIFNSVSDI